MSMALMIENKNSTAFFNALLHIIRKRKKLQQLQVYAVCAKIRVNFVGKFILRRCLKHL